MSARNDIEYQSRLECHALARDMVRLDQRVAWAREAREWERMYELMLEREAVQAHRSGLLRAVWAWQRRRKGWRT